jgi:hypothetical protein
MIAPIDDRPLIERFGLIIRPDEEWLLNEHGLNDAQVRHAIFDQRARAKQSGHGKPRIDPVDLD